MQISLVHYTAHLLDRQAGYLPGALQDRVWKSTTRVRTNAGRSQWPVATSDVSLRRPVKPFIVSCTKALIYHANASRSCPPSSYLNYVDLSRLSASAAACSPVCQHTHRRSILHAASDLARYLGSCTKYVYEYRHYDFSSFNTRCCNFAFVVYHFVDPITNVLCVVNVQAYLAYFCICVLVH